MGEKKIFLLYFSWFKSTLLLLVRLKLQIWKNDHWQVIKATQVSDARRHLNLSWRLPQYNARRFVHRHTLSIFCWLVWDASLLRFTLSKKILQNVIVAFFQKTKICKHVSCPQHWHNPSYVNIFVYSKWENFLNNIYISPWTSPWNSPQLTLLFCYGVL